MEIKENIATDFQSEILEKFNYMLCPHSAVGGAAFNNLTGNKMLFASTAHPNKFDIETSGSTLPQSHPWLRNFEANENHKKIYPGDITSYSHFKGVGAF